MRSRKGGRGSIGGSAGLVDRHPSLCSNTKQPLEKQASIVFQVTKSKPVSANSCTILINVGEKEKDEGRNFQKDQVVVDDGLCK